jgi:hypothetical protein
MKVSIFFSLYLLLFTVDKSTSFDLGYIKTLTFQRPEIQKALNKCAARNSQSRKLSSFQVSISSIPVTKDSEPKQVYSDYNAIAKSVFESDKRPVILFDGVCNLCNGGVNFALDHDKNGKE